MMWGGKLLNGIKSMYFDSSACDRIKGVISEQFQCIYGSSDEGDEDEDGKERSELS